MPVRTLDAPVVPLSGAALRSVTHARSPVRALRAAVFAALCVALAAAGHAHMSGHDIPPGALLAAFGVTAATAWWAAGRQCGPCTMGAGLLAVQGALHLIFAGAQPGAPASSAHRPGQLSHEQMHAGAGQGMSAMEDMAGAGGHGGHGSLGMLAVHLLAAVVCALWLARAEAAFFRLARAVDVRAFSPLRLLFTRVPLPEVPAPPRPRARPGPSRFLDVVLAHVLSRRGPPAFPVMRATTPGAVD
jgi:hypothetical protein